MLIFYSIHQLLLISQFLRQSKGKIASLPTFKKYKPFFIRPFQKRECCCPTCIDFFKSKGEERSQLEVKYKEHLDMMHTQFFYYKEKMTEIREDEAMVLMDFGGGFLLPSAQYETSVEYFKKRKVNDLVVVLIFKDLNQGLKIQYYDFICDTIKTDSRYVSTVWYYMFVLDMFKDFKTLYVFSDNGPHHFMTVQTLNLFRELQQTFHTTIFYNTFESYHGKGLYDAHTGVAKRMIKQAAISGHDIRTVSDIIDVLDKIKDTFVIEIPMDALMSKTYYSLPREGVKKFHHFYYKDSDPEHIFCKVHSNDVEWVDQISRPISPKVKSAIKRKHQEHKCSKCHQPGHNSATCPNNK